MRCCIHMTTVAMSYFRFRVESAVCIHSPPRAAGGQSSEDMYDPDTYYRKFAVYGEIVFITVCLKNGNLMKVCGVDTIQDQR